MPVTQEQYYKAHAGTEQFFAFHPARSDADRKTGLVIAPAIFEEKQDAHRAGVNFANRVAEAGISVLRFDYRGQGESRGELHEFSPEDLMADVRFACDELRAKGDFNKIGIVGVRYGANLAINALTDLKVDYLVGWSPVYDGENYAKTILWTNLTTQMMVHRKIVEDRKVLLAKLEEGKLVDVDGYKLNLEWYEHLCGYNLSEAVKAAKTPMLLMDIAANPEQENKRWSQLAKDLSGADGVQLKRVRGDMFWRLTQVYAVRPKDTFDTSEEFILSHAG